jgi:hypothetical protein
LVVVDGLDPLSLLDPNQDRFHTVEILQALFDDGSSNTTTAEPPGISRTRIVESEASMPPFHAGPEGH